MKKSQIQNQIFIYVIAFIVVFLILAYGYKVIRGFTEKSDQVALVQFETDLRNAVEKMSYEYQSVIKKELVVPSNYDKVCIIDLGKPATGAPTLPNLQPIVFDSWESNVTKNVFLIKNIAQTSFFVGNITIDNAEGYICADVQKSKLTLRLEGTGKKTKVSLW